MKFIALALWLSIALASPTLALDLPPLNATINDFAGMLPPASIDDLTMRLKRFHTETARTVVILTVKSLDGEDLDELGSRAFTKLPLSESDRANTALLVVVRKEHLVGLQAGTQLRALLPKPSTVEKLRGQVLLYADGLRADLGVHGAVHYLLRVIRGEVRVDSLTDEEKLESASTRGAGAGPIFAICLGPFLAFFIGGLWGIYATQYGVERRLRLLMGAVFGGAMAKAVIALAGLLGSVSDPVWYFTMALAIPFGVFGSLTEFWMAGDWRGIPRVKKPRGKPEDNMGI
jgi:uncharacterized protein